ncbi:MAG: hypothetical protein HC902_03460 [Calothrix sp. SM1_5_4]|nr:hypothetical protein [Calothrix sp. SM1_5_4]
MPENLASPLQFTNSDLPGVAFCCFSERFHVTNVGDVRTFRHWLGDSIMGFKRLFAFASFGVLIGANSFAQTSANSKLLLTLPTGHIVGGVFPINGDSEFIINHRPAWSLETNTLYYKNGQATPLLACEEKKECSVQILEVVANKAIVAISEKGSDEHYGVLDLRSRTVIGFQPHQVQPGYQFEDAGINLDNFRLLSDDIVVFAGNQHERGNNSGLYSVRIGVPGSVVLVEPKIQSIFQTAKRSSNAYGPLIQRNENGVLVIETSEGMCQLGLAGQAVTKRCVGVGPRQHSYPPEEFSTISRYVRNKRDSASYVTTVGDKIVFHTLTPGGGKRFGMYLKIAPINSPQDAVTINQGSSLHEMLVNGTHIFYQVTQSKSDDIKEDVTKLWSFHLQ